ncbi:hypothetical protein [Roseivirga sp.]|uniref:hypothetical protein n=1 Tax=Roseivirga sp. TaxID=1964215 RepID=UPI003B522A8E
MKKKLYTLLMLFVSTFAFAQWSGTNPIYYNGGKVGIGTDSPSYKLHTVGDIYSLWGYKVGETNQVTSDAMFDGYKSSSSTGAVFGIKILRYLSGSTVNIGGIYGLKVESGPSFSSSATNVYGIYTKALAFGENSTATNAYSLYSDSPTGSITNSFNIYAAGSTKSYFGGNVGIGTTSPNAKLEVTGATRINSTTPVLHFLENDITDSNFQIDVSGGNLNFRTNNDSFTNASTKMSILNNGNVGMGTTTPGEKLEVNGTIRSKKVKVEASGWPDYVFADNYQLPSLTDIENFIKTNGHLPEVPSAKEVTENGLDLGDMEATLLKKVEEMTLYMIEMKKEVEALKEENKTLKARIENK